MIIIYISIYYFIEAFGQQECLTAFVPDAQFIPGLDVWKFGDAFLRTFYTVMEILPLRRVGFAKG